MTVEEFESLIWSYARAHGNPFIEWTERNKLRLFVNRHLQRFVELTKVLYDDDIDFDTTASDDGTYDLTDTDVFARIVLEPEYVIVNGNACLGFDGLPGFTSVQELNDLPYDYRTVARGTPEYAALIPPNTLRLVPRPSAVLDCAIAGWYQHYDLTGSAVLDTTDIDLPNGAIDAAAQFIAAELIMVEAEGEAIKKAQFLAERGLAQGKKAATRSSSFLQGQMVRGRRHRHNYTLD